MINSGCQHPPNLELLAATTINFPAASGLAFLHDTLYVFGDNSPSLLALTANWQPAGEHRFWKGNAAIINKEEKPDIESALVLKQDGAPVLMGIGSMSTANRWMSYTYRPGTDSVEPVQLFSQGARFNGIEEINIEGSTAYGRDILLGNRANLATKRNHLLWWQGRQKVVVKLFTLPEGDYVAGLSGLHYVEKDDLLLFTASEEATASAYEDGAIGHSYLGWIAQFSKAIQQTELTPTGVLKLASFSQKFRHQKIESVCVEGQTGRRFVLHLAADNDDGKTTLFKVALTL